MTESDELDESDEDETGQDSDQSSIDATYLNPSHNATESLESVAAKAEKDDPDTTQIPIIIKTEPPTGIPLPKLKL